MSGMDERKRLWIFTYKEWVGEDYTYKEWVGEDYVYSYRGIMAQHKEEAEKIGKMIVLYYNTVFDGFEDIENPDYIFIRVKLPEEDKSFEDKSFMFEEGALESFRKTLIECVEEAD